MVHIEVGKSYIPLVISNKDQLYQVQKVEYSQVNIETAKDLKLIGEAFYWATLLV